MSEPGATSAEAGSARWIFLGGAILSVAGSILIGLHYDAVQVNVALVMWIPVLLQEWNIVQPRPPRRPPRRIRRPLSSREAIVGQVIVTGAFVLFALAVTVLFVYINVGGRHRIPSLGEGIAAIVALLISAAVVTAIYFRNTRRRTAEPGNEESD